MRTALVVLSLALAACSGPVNLGSDLIWFTENEGADTSDWSDDGSGGLELGAAGSDALLSTAEARSGRQSVLLVTPATGEDSGALLYRMFALGSEAYYSAWYFLPRAYALNSYLTIMKFHSQEPADDSVHERGIDVNLRSLRDGTFVLYPLHHDNAFLVPPLAQPAPVIEVGRWFHVEVFFRAARDATGQATIWLDGRRVYDLDARPTLVADGAHFTVCNLSRDAEPDSLEIYVDDVAVSRSRVTEHGVLR